MLERWTVTLLGALGIVWFAELLTVLAHPQSAQVPSITLKSVRQTEPVATDADDPAIWVHPTDRSRSMIIGTDKGGDGEGAVYVFSLNGKVLQRIGNVQRPNNVDVQQGVRFGARTMDIAVATERRANRLRVFRVRGSAPYMTDISGNTRVFADATGDEALPMGIALYKRPKDGTVYAIVSRKSGPREDYLGQYRLSLDANGKVNVSRVRYFGAYSGKQEIESVCVDDELGYVYYSDENFGVRKYHADPDSPQAGRELATFATRGYQGDHEGIAIMPTGPRKGYIISTEQIKGGSRYHVFPREGRQGRPHYHPELAVLTGSADDTDGIEAAAGDFGPGLRSGMLVAMNSEGRNFILFAWPGTLK